jgi:large subunit ribosomal protein L4e
MEIPIKDRSGDDVGTRDLPDVFETPYRPDVIKKAFDVARANEAQDYGTDETAGKKHAADTWGGPGAGTSRVPRQTQGNEAVLMPGSRGGRRAHPPKVEKDRTEKVNRKERRLAFRSALSAAADSERVRDRGHEIEDDVDTPVVVDDSVESITKTQEAIEALENLGLGPDLERAREGRNVRAGKGKRRGRRYRTPTSALVVTTAPEEIGRAVSNLPGVEVETPQGLDVRDLAPGADPGRLVVLTTSALDELEGSR